MKDVSIIALHPDDIKLVQKHYLKLSFGNSFEKASWQIVDNRLAVKIYYVDRKAMLFAIMLNMPHSKYESIIGEHKFRIMYLNIRKKQLFQLKQTVEEIQNEIDLIENASPNVFEMVVRGIKVKMVGFAYPSRAKVNVHMHAISFNRTTSFIEFVREHDYKFFLLKNIAGVIIAKFGVDDYPEL